MSFSELLKESVQRVDGAVSAMILGTDGMPVETFSHEGSINADSLGAESSQLMKNLETLTENLGIGGANEFSLATDQFKILMRRINTDYYAALILKPEGNLGKGRFVLSTVVPKLREEF